MDKILNYAVVGLGVGMSHCRGAAQAEGARLYAVCDLMEDRLAKAHEEYPEAKLYNDYDKLLADPEVDIVSVCVPSGMHAKLAIQALRAGKHVLVEKPMDIAVDRILEIEKVRQETGLKVGGVFQNRRNAIMAPMKQAIDEGRLGKIITGAFRVYWYRSEDYFRANGHWRGTWEYDGGGSLMNQGVHTVDLMQWLLGDVASVRADAAILDHKEIETEDFVFATVKFKSGAIVLLSSTTCAYPGISTDIQVIGTNGTIFVDGDRPVVWKIKGDRMKEEEKEIIDAFAGNGSAAWADPTLIRGHSYMVQDMVDAVRFDRDPMVGPMEATKAVRIVNAVYESAKTGKEIFFD
ncbi:MAG: Gfo/Idh/MocA family oxidoreductase [Clostridiales bacterium]|nr:Gfo/Idh/MocA family oxidoreductase [Clostridiales bacterium]